MTANTDGVRAYLAAATTESDATDAALAEVLSADVVLSGPLGEGHGPQAVLDGLAMLRPLFSTGTWAEPVADGDVVRLTATFPPGRVLGSASLAFGFDASGVITSLQQTLAPGAPPPPVPVALDNDIGAVIDGALDNGTTVIAAYVDADGQPQLSFRGTTQAYGSDGLALWIRDPGGGLVPRAGRQPEAHVLVLRPGHAHALPDPGPWARRSRRGCAHDGVRPQPRTRAAHRPRATRGRGRRRRRSGDRARAGRAGQHAARRQVNLASSSAK